MENSKSNLIKIANNHRTEKTPRRLSGGESLMAEKSPIFRMIEELEPLEDDDKSISDSSNSTNSSDREEEYGDFRDVESVEGEELEDLIFAMDEIIPNAKFGGPAVAQNIINRQNPRNS